MTALQLITAAYQRLGVVDPEETLTGALASVGLLRLNDYIADVLANDRLAIFSITRTVWTLAANQASYTVGSGGQIDVIRPVTMNMQGCNVQFIDTSFSPTTEIPLQPLTDDAYQVIPQKTVSATYPTSWYYNPTYTSDVAPYATLSLWPVPNVSTLQGVFYAPSPAQAVTLSTTLAWPPGYTRFLRDNLAVELAPDAAVQPSESLVASARESKASVLSTNTRLVDLGIDLALVPYRRRSNIYTGP